MLKAFMPAPREFKEGLLRVRAWGVLPLAPPGVRHAAYNGAEHESGDEGEEHEVDEPFQAVVAQARHGLDVVLQQERGVGVGGGHRFNHGMYK